MKPLVAGHPSVKKDVQDLFIVSDSGFRAYSDDLLQYVCGRKCEIIEKRRKQFLPRSTQIASLPEAILPSRSHLFAEEPLAELTRQYGDSFRSSFNNRVFTAMTGHLTKRREAKRKTNFRSTSFRVRANRKTATRSCKERGRRL